MSFIERAIQKVEPERKTDPSRSQNKRHFKKNLHSPSSRDFKTLQRMAESKQLSNDELTKMGIVTDRKAVNAYRETRTEILKATGGHSSVIAVSSCKDQDGASFVATNLAVSFAQDTTKSALLIDCNFRSPTIADTLNIDLGADLTDFLTGNAEVEEIIYPVGINKLRVIPTRISGISQIDSFTTSSMLGELIYELKNRYKDRYIILDVADIEASADAKILDLIADYSILVMGHDTTTEEELQNAIDGFNPEKFLGIIYNHCS